MSYLWNLPYVCPTRLGIACMDVHVENLKKRYPTNTCAQVHVLGTFCAFNVDAFATKHDSAVVLI